MPFDHSYVGMSSYEQASREAARLIGRHGWFRSIDALVELAAIMRKCQSDDLWMTAYGRDDARSDDHSIDIADVLR